MKWPFEWRFDGREWKIVAAAKRKPVSRQKRTLVNVTEEAPFDTLLKGYISPRMYSAMRDIVSDPECNLGCRMMMERQDEFSSPIEAMITGLGVFAPSRKLFDESFDMICARTTIPNKIVDELVIGSGLHAAIYCAVRYAKTGKKPYVVEAAPRAGGVFAVSSNPSFWLNSRNRPGRLGKPGENDGLNVLQGAMIQPSNVSGGEYQTNTEMAFAVRANLMMFAEAVLPNMKATAISVSGSGATRKFKVVMANGEIMNARRVVITTGLGRRLNLSKLDRVISFETFMSMMDQPFPLRGMDRVAVVGSGDSGKAAIEALCGQAPTSGMSVATLDWPSKIDWWGAKFLDTDTWCAANRGRYSKIGKLLNRRVFPLTARADNICASYRGITIRERNYDWVINCTGFSPGTDIDIPGVYDWLNVGGRRVGMQKIPGTGASVYVLGPAAAIPVSDLEREQNIAMRTVPENSTALFRYADRTAAFADFE